MTDTALAGLSLETVAAIAAMAFAGTWSPGPNNALLSASGARFGFRATLPHARGVALGFPAMLFALALGMGAVFRQSELLRETLRWGGAALLVWLAWRTATAPAPGKGGGRARPFTFLEAAAFQWINPKAWIMALAVISQFADGSAPLRDAGVIAAVYAVSGLGSSHSWAGLGAAIGRFLGDGWRLRAFNLVMAALLLAGVAALLTEDLTPPPA
ncbi:MAG: LysE family translocator [Pseudomonadota bacterium]|nr:LysE family translocator [Pseudomonadota bacterium]MEE3101627.1 LysE family translocator [Pseudomonadota bacterium]